MRAATAEAHDLMLHGANALASVEANGIRIDMDRLNQSISDTEAAIKQIEKELTSDDVIWPQMRRKFGQKANLGSRPQIAKILFQEMGYTSTKKTAKGADQLDEEVVASIDLPWLRKWINRSKLDKVRGTYLAGLKRETVFHKDIASNACLWLLHPFYNLHTTTSYRSSSDSPNFQNMPIRNPAFAEIIRSCFIPRPGRRLVEIDFSGAEVRVAACYHKDPTMLKYLADPSSDMHRDVASECFMLEAGQVPKSCRQAAKGGFTFAAFYGDFWMSMAANLWEMMVKDKLTTMQGVPLRQHLESRGITGLGSINSDDLKRAKDQKTKIELKDGTFQKHIHTVERGFWDDRFPVYNDWRNNFYNEYKKNGFFETLTGFYLDIPMRRNEVINNPVQGSSFHCLLWAMCRIQKLMTKQGIRGCIVGQIHDSIVADVVDEDVAKYLALAKHVIEVELPKHYKWLQVVGMKAEAKLSRVAERGGNWHFMKEQAL